MKRHTQKTGVRKWAGEDFLELQSEALKALDGFFAEYGPCVAKGCEITKNGSRYDIAPGLVVLNGADQDGGEATMIVPFKGAAGVSLPVYLTLACTVRERAYKNAEVKPIAYEYHAEASTVPPADTAEYLTISETATPRFVDVLQDSKHRFLTDAERVKWDAKETPEGAQSKVTAALNSAKQYADTRDEAVLGIADVRDLATLRSAKDYADTIVAALVDNSPQALNTLQELAASLGNDPNFATTVLQKIGEKVSTVTFNALITEKADKATSFVNYRGEIQIENLDTFVSRESGTYIVVHPLYTSQLTVFKAGAGSTSALEIQHSYDFSIFRYRNAIDNSRYSPWVNIWTEKTFNPATKANAGMIYDNNLNNATTAGIYALDGTITNTPVASGNYRLLVMGTNAARVTQVAFPWDSDRMFFRRKIDDIWSTWMEVCHSGNNGTLVAAGNVDIYGNLTLYKGYAYVNRTASGFYTIVHNAATAYYTVLLTPLTDDRQIYIRSKSSNSCVIRGSSLADSDRDCAFDFRIERYN